MGSKTKKQQRQSAWKESIAYSILALGFFPSPTIRILFMGLIVLCFLFFNWMNKIWLVYIGIILFVIGFFVFGGMARAAFKKKGETSKNKHWLETKKIVDSGIYAVVRHPIYISFMFYVMGLILVSQHWLSLVLGIPIIIFFYQFIRMEEQSNIEKFGDDYKQYMQKVPRTNFLLGIFRLIQRRNNE
jgi:protein-S-isoprenylcysteine O-methyltransferase Ste14